MHQQTKSMAITRDIAGWIAGIRNTDLPDAVRQAVSELSLDTGSVRCRRQRSH